MKLPARVLSVAVPCVLLVSTVPAAWAAKANPAPRITADDSFYITEVSLLARQAADEKKMIAVAPRRAVRDSK